MSDRDDGVRGVRFALRIPLRVADVAAQHHPIAVPAAAAATEHGVVGSNTAASAAPVMPLRLLVVVVDDAAGNRRVAARMLQQLGCTVATASDGDEVEAAISEARIAEHRGVDAILMDISMVRVNGDVAARELRSSGCSIPIIAVTGDADATDAAACACSRARDGAARARWCHGSCVFVCVCVCACVCVCVCVFVCAREMCTMRASIDLVHRCARVRD